MPGAKGIRDDGVKRCESPRMIGYIEVVDDSSGDGVAQISLPEKAG